MKTLLRTFVPAMITGGPLFIAIAGGRGASPSTEWLNLSLAGYAGALALALGLVAMFVDLARQDKEIRRLRQLLAQ